MTQKHQHPENAICSFCGRTEENVEKLISGPNAFICDKCIKLCNQILEKKEVSTEPFRILKPKEIKERLDQYIIGQEEAKKTISVAVYNHYKRISNPDKEQAVEFNKSNVLLFGPTGSGKTLIARTLATILDVPFAIADATTLTEAGYVGEDVENIILRLLQAADYDVAKTERGIIYVDEIDKITRTTSNVSITRDVSGEGVQQALLKIVEGTIANVPPKGGRKHPNQEYIKVNTENILFIVGGAFVNLDKVVAKRLGKSIIGFGQGEQQEIQAQDKSWLLSKSEPEDFIHFGMIPEFVGRFHSIANFNELKQEDLVKILTEPKNAVIKQFQEMFKLENIKLTFTQEALETIAKKAMEAGTGARALRMILEKLMRDMMFEAPSDTSISAIEIDNDVVMGVKKPLIKRSNEKIA
jgi:ATP-dependent Clp protease ATP-binding subunit ClpX